MPPESTLRFVRLRRAHVSRLLLASRRAPLAVGCLRLRFEANQGELRWEDAVEKLAEIFPEHANHEEFDIAAAEPIATARAEIRDWLKQGFVVEREGRLIATDALQKAFDFIAGPEEKYMTSTASRLSTVQREIEALETRVNPDRQKRAEHLGRRIAALEAELARVEQGDFEVLSGAPAREGIQNVYKLALSLRADFHRVEDSYRDADRALGQNIVRSDQNRGSVLDQLKTRGIVSEPDPRGEVVICPLITRLAKPETLTGLLAHFRKMGSGAESPGSVS